MSEFKSNQTSNSMLISASLLLRLLIYISVAVAISLPSYVRNDHLFDCCVKSKNREGINNMGTFIRAQQAYHLEHNRFADSISELGLGIQTETNNYHYRIVQPMIPVQDLEHSLNYDSDLSIRIMIAQNKVKYIEHDTLKTYLGIVYTMPETDASGKTEISTRAILCEMPEEKPLPTTMPTLINANMQCPAGSIKLGE